MDNSGDGLRVGDRIVVKNLKAKEQSAFNGQAGLIKSSIYDDR